MTTWPTVMVTGHRPQHLPRWEHDEMDEPNTQPVREHIVVVFGAAPADGWCELNRCPMHAHGPYTGDEARQVADGLPEWMQPHILTLAKDGDACLRTRLELVT